MPKIAKELSALEVNRLKSPGLFMVGGIPGLCLRVSDTGARSWILRATIGAKRRDLGLGAYPAVTLAQAKELARGARDVIRQGRDPLLERQAARSALRASQASAITFEKAAAAFIKTKEVEWSNPKHIQQWRNTLEDYAFPLIGKMNVADVVRAHVLQILEPIWLTKTETATRVRQRIENVLDWAEAHGARQGKNPATWKGNLDKLLAAPRKVSKVKHHPAVPVDLAAEFYRKLQKIPGSAARALEVLTLTATRSNEVLGAKWEEFDFEKRIWTIPADRMKAKVEHRVPMSGSLIRVLREHPHHEGIDFVFVGTRSLGKLSDMTMTVLMRRMKLGVKAVPHGMRSTFRDWVAEQTDFPRDMAEKALAHTLESSVEAAYQRGDMMERRRAMMEAWAQFLATPVVKDGTVVPIRKNMAT